MKTIFLALVFFLLLDLPCGVSTPTIKPTVALIAPENGVTTSTTPTFEWEEVNTPGIDYNLVVSANSDLSNPVIDLTGFEKPVYEVSSGKALELFTTYYWSVRVVISGTPGSFAHVYSFVTEK